MLVPNPLLESSSESSEKEFVKLPNGKLCKPHYLLVYPQLVYFQAKLQLKSILLRFQKEEANLKVPRMNACVKDLLELKQQVTK